MCPTSVPSSWPCGDGARCKSNMDIESSRDGSSARHEASFLHGGSVWCLQTLPEPSLGKLALWLKSKACPIKALT